VYYGCLTKKAPSFDVSKHSKGFTSYLAPSWSWVPAAGSVRYIYDERVPSSNDATIASYDIPHRASEPMGEVMVYYLVIQAVSMDLCHHPLYCGTGSIRV
jgi:hypothetical protein